MTFRIPAVPPGQSARVDARDDAVEFFIFFPRRVVASSPFPPRAEEHASVPECFTARAHVIHERLARASFALAPCARRGDDDRVAPDEIRRGLYLAIRVRRPRARWVVYRVVAVLLRVEDVLVRHSSYPDGVRDRRVASARDAYAVTR